MVTLYSLIFYHIPKFKLEFGYKYKKMQSLSVIEYNKNRKYILFSNLFILNTEIGNHSILKMYS